MRRDVACVCDEMLAFRRTAKLTVITEHDEQEPLLHRVDVRREAGVGVEWRAALVVVNGGVRGEHVQGAGYHRVPRVAEHVVRRVTPQCRCERAFGQKLHGQEGHCDACGREQHHAVLSSNQCIYTEFLQHVWS